VTYSQTIILADPKTDRIQRQRNYAVTAAHELSHQWFGDMVTTAWWDDIWLNEAFATWMERKLIAGWKPEWATRVGDVNNTLGAENDDSLISARKIRQPILSNDDISNAFDNITYQKGAAVIGMFENWMGAADFQRGVQAYLKQYMYRATTAGDFLDAMSSSSKKDVTKPFFTFLDQAGVPLLSVKLDCTGPKPALKVEQKRFLPLGSKGAADKASTDQIWGLPLCFRYGTGSSGQSKCVLVNDAAATISLDEAKGCPAWVQANDNAMGYYHVDYQDGLLTALTSGDVQARLTAAERVEIMGDAEALSEAGKLPMADTLALVETFHADPDRTVVQRALAVAMSPRAQLVPDALTPNYQRFLIKNFGAKARELGWTPVANDTDDTRLLRAQIVRPVATWGGDQMLADQAKALTEKWFADHTAVDSNLTASVLGTAAFYGDEALFQKFLAEYEKAKDRQLRQTLLGAMTSFRDPAAIQAGENALLRGDVPFLEGTSLLFAGQGQAATRKLGFDFVKANWNDVTAKMPTGGGADYGARLPRVGSSWCDEASRNELNDWFAPKVGQFSGAPRELAQIVEGIDLCIADKAAEAPSVAAFLARF
jgi:alanyl aminopeptidase